MMLLKKGLTAGVVLLVIGFGINWLAQVIFPSIAQEYQNTSIFRPWTDPLMMVFYGYPFVLGLVLAYLWERVKEKNPLEFAKLYFVIATIPGMFITYTSFQVSLFLVLTWTISGVLQAYVAGFLFAKIK